MSKIGHIAKGARPMIRDVCEAGCTYAAISTANVLYASRRSNSLEFSLTYVQIPDTELLGVATGFAQDSGYTSSVISNGISFWQ